jgi:hypothetical protein
MVICQAGASALSFCRDDIIEVLTQQPSGWWDGLSRHAQKGTIGITYRQEDMPFTTEGFVTSAFDIIASLMKIANDIRLGYLGSLPRYVWPWGTEVA